MSPVSKISDIAFVRFAAPDLDRMQTFLEEFGLQCAERTEEKLYMRGVGPSPFLHVTEKGEPRFIGFGVHVADKATLEALAAHDGAKVEPFDAPAGGMVVRLTDPDGLVVEAVASQASTPPLPSPSVQPWNEAGKTVRPIPRDVAKGPSHVLRIGHVVFAAADFARAEAWYKTRFGLLTSDEIQADNGKAIGAFMRCNKGATPADHHSILLFERPDAVGFKHVAFEVIDFDDLMAGHDYLAAKERAHYWGVGRHALGSQIFDYWLDPWGHQVEHWTDGDRLSADVPPQIADRKRLLDVHWGTPHSAPPKV